MYKNFEEKFGYLPEEYKIIKLNLKKRKKIFLVVVLISSVAFYLYFGWANELIFREIYK